MPKTEITPEIVATIKRARQLGYKNHVIASYYWINQGRVAEVNTGQRGAGILPAESLPPDFPNLA